jgi:hypothetical protein
VSDNNKESVFAYAKDFSATLSPTRGKGIGYASREMTEVPSLTKGWHGKAMTGDLFKEILSQSVGLTAPLLKGHGAARCA